MSDPPITAQVAAPSPIYRRGIAAVLVENDVHVVASVADGNELLAAGATDVVVAHLELPGIGEAMRELKMREHRTRVVLLLGSSEGATVDTALRYGSDALVLEDASAAELLTAAHAVMCDRGWISSGLAPAVLRQARSGIARRSTLDATAGLLSRREREVLVLVAAGLSNRQIAHRLFIAENTVKNHVRHILAKLELSSRVEATLYAVSVGLVGSGDLG